MGDQDERVGAVTGTSTESLEVAAGEALAQMPAAGQMKSARVVAQELTDGGIAPGLQYHVTLVAASPPPDV